jgi:hypothetical protein
MGEILHRSKQGISAAKNGRRELPVQDLFALACASGSARAYMEAGYEATGGRTSPYLDGENVNHDILNVFMVLKQEYKEAMDAIDSVLPFFYNKPNLNDELLRKRMEDVWLQIHDTVVGSENSQADIANVFGLSQDELLIKHTEKLYLRKYTKKKTTFVRSGR